MARGKRRAPLKPTTDLPAPDGLLNDEVDDFVAQRHKVMLDTTKRNESDSEDLGDEPEQKETNVFNIDMSDSEEENGEEDEEEDAVDDREERLGFGGRKRDWYGGDTHEYEIMEDEEREQALKDEEEEAVRLQQEALARLQPEDYEDEEDDDVEEGDEGEVEGGKWGRDKVAGEVLQAAAPEVPLLIKEMEKCCKEMSVWKERLGWGEVARVVYHLLSSFVSNVLFYLSLRTDPDAEGVDVRSHPVLAQIVWIRGLLKEAMALPCEPPVENKEKEMRTVVDNEVEEMGDGKYEHTNGVSKNVPNGTSSEILADDEELQQKRKERKRKRRDMRKQAKAKKALLQSVEDDEDNVLALLQKSDVGEDPDEGERAQERKRRKLNKLIGAMERDRKNRDEKRMVSADADVMRVEPTAKKVSIPGANIANEEGDMQIAEMDDDEEVMQKMLAKKAKKDARKARKIAEMQPHVYTFKEDVNPDSRRKASSQIAKNRGLTRYRPKDKKTPRTRNRLAYSKAVVRRKGAVQDYSGKPGVTYSGEASGINMSVRKGSKLSNV